MASNLEKYNQAFVEALNISEDQLGEELAFESISAWDSVGHMELVALLEDAFDIMMDTDDIIDFTSYNVGKQLMEKYGVEL